MKTSLILAFYFFFQGTEIPFKNSEEFQVQIDLKYKVKESEYKNIYNSTGGQNEVHGTSQPFLSVNITQLKILSDEVKIHAVSSKGRSLFNKKCSSDDIRLKMGFISDLKQGEGTNQVTIVFLSEEKKELRKIELAVLKDGTFLVNGKWHGQF